MYSRWTWFASAAAIMVAGPIVLWLTNRLPLSVEGFLFTHGLWQTPSTVDQDLVFFLWFVCTWLVGFVLYVITLKFTKGMSNGKRAAACTFVLALAFAPTVFFQHGVFPLPAVFVFLNPLLLLGSPLEWLALGVAPIVVLWALIWWAWKSPVIAQKESR